MGQRRLAFSGCCKKGSKATYFGSGAKGGEAMSLGHWTGSEEDGWARLSLGRAFGT
jgi:hypothetical protein